MGGGAIPDAKVVHERGQKLLASDYFVALGVTQVSTPDQVQSAFYEAVKEWHPDRVPSGLDALKPLFAQVFARLETARQTLTDPAKRQRYLEDAAKQKRATSGDLSSAEASLEFKKAEALLKKNDVVMAETHLRRALQLVPANPEYQARLVSLLAKPTSTPDELKKLVGDLDRVIDRSPSCERAYFFRGQLRKRLDLNDQANADFERAAELDPNNIEAAREVRIYRMRQGRSPDAPGTTAKDGTADGVGGFFRKLFKR
jgi:curved DNA-binding protein CbpA